MSDANKGLAVLDMSRERRPKKTTIQERADSLRDLWDKGLPGGDKTGWESVNHLYSVAPGQLTILTGWPSSGKSEWLDALLCNLHGWRFVMCSPENQPVELHMAKLMEKVAKKPFGRGPNERIQRDEINEFADVLRNFTFLEPPSSGAFQIADVLREAQDILGDEGKRGLVLDPWNEFESTRPAGLSETEYVSQTLSLIRNWARKQKVHVWIVAHPQKMRLADGTLPVPRPDMISGSQNWWNKADICITVYRDFQKQDDTVQIHVQKCRFKHVGRQGVAELRYDRVTGLYSEKPEYVHEQRERYRGKGNAYDA